MSAERRRLTLSLACGDYEITRPLIDGTVVPSGVDLVVLAEDKERIFRLDRRNECDVAEFNVVQYLRARAAGEPIAALPVFLHRRFRHGSIYIRDDRGIKSPVDLAGRSIGIGGFEPAAAVWLRGLLEDRYDVPFSSVDWVDPFGAFGRLPDGQSSPLSPKDPASRFRIDGLLREGAIDALVSAFEPTMLRDPDGHVRTLFDDPKQESLRYWRETGIFPIMHVLTVSGAVIEEHPWVAASLMQAFERAKGQATERLRDPRVLPLAFWSEALAEQTTELGQDPWQYGLTPGNRLALDAIVRYAREQGLAETTESLDELFLAVDDYGPAARFI